MADPAPMPMPAADPGAVAPPADAGDDAGAGSSVLCTVLDNGDGTFTLVAGDEDEGGGGDVGSLVGAPPGAGGGPDTGAGAPGDSGAPQGQTFDSPGPLLKAILDLVKNAQASASGEGTDSDNFNSGFSGAPGAGSSNPIAQKY